VFWAGQLKAEGPGCLRIRFESRENTIEVVAGFLIAAFAVGLVVAVDVPGRSLFGES